MTELIYALFECLAEFWRPESDKGDGDTERFTTLFTSLAIALLILAGALLSLAQ